MSNARNLADLLDSTGDVKSDALDNVSGLPEAIDVDASAPADSLNIDSSGNVGIGVATTFQPGGSRRLLQVTNGSSGGQIALSNDSNESENPRIFSDVDNLGFATASTGGGYMQFYTAGTEHMRITSDGRGLSQFTAKAWVMANATGTPSIYDSHNISSLTDYETGQLGCNFANNMSNTNYAVIANGWGGYAWTFGYFDRYTSVFRLVGSNGSAYADAPEVSAVVFGD